MVDIQEALKKIYKWLYGNDDYPKCVSCVKTTEKKNNERLPEEIFREVEIRNIIYG